MVLIWEERYAIAVAAFAGTELPRQNSMVGQARDYLRSVLGSAEDLPGTLESLPPIALHFLALAREHSNTRDLFQDGGLGGNATTALEAALARLEGGQSDYGRIRLFVSHLLWTTAEPRRLRELWRSLFSKHAELPDLVEREWALGVLRDQFSTLAERTVAIAALANDFAEDGKRWAQVENLLCASLYVWPVLVVDRDGGRMAIGLPMGIDVEVPRRHLPGVPPSRVLYDRALLDLAEWETKNLPHVVAVAKQLWKSSHGHYGRFKRDILRARIIFDFRTAGRVLDCLRGGGARNWQPISIGDDSADGYMAQAVLGRLLGRSTGQLGLMTGTIGDQLVRGEEVQLDWYLGGVDVEGVQRKLRFAFASHGFEYVVLPRDEATVAAVANLPEIRKAIDADAPVIVQRSRVLFSETLRRASGIMQEEAFFREVFVRAPDVALGMRQGRRQEVVPTGSAKQLLDDLAKGGTIVETAASPHEIGEVLAYLGLRLRFGLEKDNYGYPPPMLFTVCLRVLPTERDSLFWRVLWNSIGAPQTDLGHLLAADYDDARQLLIKVLNRRAPSRYAPKHRAPDLLFVLGWEHLELEAERSQLAEHRPLLVEPLLRSLEGALRPTADPRYEPLLANSRIVLVRGARELANPRWRRRGDGLPEQVLEGLRELTVFDYGFRYEDARFILEEQRAANVLHAAAHAGNESGQRDGNGLYYGRGVYFLDSELRSRLQRGVSQPKLLELHQRAAGALSPLACGRGAAYAMGAPPPIDLGRTTEALQHLYHARVLAQELGEPTQEIRQRDHDLRSFTAPMGWALLRVHTEKGENKEAYQCALDLERLGGHPHALNYLHAMRAAYKYARGLPADSPQYSDVSRDLQRWRGAVQHWKSNDPAMAKAVTLGLMAFELNEARDLRDEERVHELAAQMREMLLSRDATPTLALDDKDILLVGGRTGDTALARQVYGVAYERNPRFVASWAACLGCEVLLNNRAASGQLLQNPPPVAPEQLRVQVARSIESARRWGWGEERFLAAQRALTRHSRWNRAKM